MKHSMKNAVLFAVLIGFSAYTVVLAAIDCSKIHAYDCSVIQGGDVVAGRAGSVPGGSTVYVIAPNGNTSGTANADGSFFIGGASIGWKRGDVITIEVGSDVCQITVEGCP